MPTQKDERQRIHDEIYLLIERISDWTFTNHAAHRAEGITASRQTEVLGDLENVRDGLRNIVDALPHYGSVCDDCLKTTTNEE